MQNHAPRLKRQLAATVVGLAPVAAHADDVTLKLGWQQIVEPSRISRADGSYEAGTCAKVSWHLFGGGSPEKKETNPALTPA